jgi:hypothetical protein
LREAALILAAMEVFDALGSQYEGKSILALQAEVDRLVGKDWLTATRGLRAALASNKEEKP